MVWSDADEGRALSKQGERKRERKGERKRALTQGKPATCGA